MNCPFCVSWNQDDPNCGHGLYQAMQAPRGWFTHHYVEAIEMGGRVRNYFRAENSTNGTSARLEHITRQAHIALDGGWKAVS